jgi:hypothetical protein
MPKSHQSHESHHEITRRVINVCDVIFLKGNHISHHIVFFASGRG